jgi:hypothetical protein
MSSPITFALSSNYTVYIKHVAVLTTSLRFPLMICAGTLVIVINVSYCFPKLFSAIPGLGNLRRYSDRLQFDSQQTFSALYSF